MNEVGRLLIGLGLVLILAGVVFGTGWLHLGSLPGDLVWRKGNVTIFLPLGTMLLLSLALSLVMALIRRL